MQGGNAHPTKIKALKTEVRDGYERQDLRLLPEDAKRAWVEHIRSQRSLAETIVLNLNYCNPLSS
jgi:hypothetical protein